MFKVTAKFSFVDPGAEAGDTVLAKGELLSLPNVLKVPLAPQPATPTLKSCVINHMCVVGQSPAKNCLHQTKLFSKNPPRATTYVKNKGVIGPNQSFEKSFEKNMRIIIYDEIW